MEWLAEQAFELRQQRYLDKEKGVVKYEDQKILSTLEL